MRLKIGNLIITLAPGVPGAGASCFLCGSFFVQRNVVAELVDTDCYWKSPVCADCLPDDQNPQTTRERAARWRDLLLSYAETLQRVISSDPPIEVPSRETFEKADEARQLYLKEPNPQHFEGVPGGTIIH